MSSTRRLGATKIVFWAPAAAAQRFFGWKLGTTATSPARSSGRSFALAGRTEPQRQRPHPPRVPSIRPRLALAEAVGRGANRRAVGRFPRTAVRRPQPPQPPPIQAPRPQQRRNPVVAPARQPPATKVLRRQLRRHPQLRRLPRRPPRARRFIRVIAARSTANAPTPTAHRRPMPTIRRTARQPPPATQTPRQPNRVPRRPPIHAPAVPAVAKAFVKSRPTARIVGFTKTPVRSSVPIAKRTSPRAHAPAATAPTGMAMRPEEAAVVAGALPAIGTAPAASRRTDAFIIVGSRARTQRRQAPCLRNHRRCQAKSSIARKSRRPRFPCRQP
jgi:hypothetical protein